MDAVGFGIICMFVGWNWVSRRIWWAEQMCKTWIGIPVNYMSYLVAGTGVLSIIAGLVFCGIGVAEMWTGKAILPHRRQG
jgi:hypothetical protein